MSKKNLEKSAKLFDTIFEDAHVLDIDFSQWNRFIQLVVESDHCPRRNKKLPIFSVNFIGVSFFSCDYIHGNVDLGDPKKYCQWNIHECERVAIDGETQSISLISSGPAPDIKVQCRDVSICELERSILDKRFGNWDQPYMPFVRFGISSCKE